MPWYSNEKDEGNHIIVGYQTYAKEAEQCMGLEEHNYATGMLVQLLLLLLRETFL